MKIFKFGGASVKDAAGVRNVRKVLGLFEGEEIGVVVSAMGKTTNALEEIISLYGNQDSTYLNKIDELHAQHLEIINELESDSDDAALRFRESGITKTIITTIESLKGELLRNKSKNYSFLYDQVVSHGELLSTQIVAAYLKSSGLNFKWLDARQLIATDNKYRDATVDWEKTESQISEEITTATFLTQGFIGSDSNGLTTTLGREGSDYTAAIIAYCLDAESVTIWKDVPGVLNADPREFQETRLLEKIPYNEAIELAFYGASVIHPKTLQPLQKKKIPLYVKSFLNPTATGTCVDSSTGMSPQTPCFIVRKNMVFLQVSSKDFNFIGEASIGDIFQQLSKFKMQVGLLQNSAISFSLCIEDKYNLQDQLISSLSEKFQVNVQPAVKLYTIRHYDKDKVSSIENDGELLLRQRTQETLQLVIKSRD
jgi:aspartate kinase